VASVISWILCKKNNILEKQYIGKTIYWKNNILEKQYIGKTIAC
jgi:hypothetical protein